MVLLYIKGMCIMVGILVYPVIFNMLWKKFTGDNLMNNNWGIAGAFMMPYVMLIGALVILSFPLIVGHALFGVNNWN